MTGQHNTKYSVRVRTTEGTNNFQQILIFANYVWNYVWNLGYIADHLPIYITQPYSAEYVKHKDKIITKRIYSQENMDAFKNELFNLTGQIFC